MLMQDMGIDWMAKEFEESNKDEFRELIKRFREWNVQWELYGEDPSRQKPVNVDGLIAQLSSEFVVIRKGGEVKCQAKQLN